MDMQRVRFLRELLVRAGKGEPTITMEFSYDNPREREPRFFGVPDVEVAQARRLYGVWGGRRLEGKPRGTTANRP